MNQCKPEILDTNEHGKMVKRILTLEEEETLPRMQGRAKKKGHQEGLQKGFGWRCVSRLSFGPKNVPFRVHEKSFTGHVPPM